MAITYNTTPSGISLSKNPVLSLVTSDETGFTSLVIKQTLHRVSDGAAIHSLYHTADENKQAEFNWSPFLDDEIQTSLPNVLTSAVNTVDILRQFFLRTLEIKDTVEGTEAQSGNFEVLKGGKGWLGFAAGLGPDLVYTPLTNEYQILTVKKKTRRVNSQDPLQITILPLVSAGTATLALTATYNDGTTELVNVDLGALTANAPVVVNISDQVRGYAALQPTKQWVKLQVTITELTGSELTLFIEPIQSPWQRYFVYENSLGAFDTFCTTGKAGYSESITKTSLNKYQPNIYTTDQALVGTANHLANGKVAVNTGYLTAAERLAVKDMLLSEKVYEFIGYNGQQLLVPVVFNTSEITLHTDGENLQAMTLEYSYAYTEATLDQII
jgi:hypothetical protein